MMKRARVDIRKARARVMTKDKKLKRSQRVKQARLENRKKNEYNFYLNHPHDQMRCFKFKTSFCQFGNKCKMQHSEVDREYGFISDRMAARIRSERNIKLTEAKGEINSFESAGEAQWSGNGWTKLVVNFDTGAAITAVPQHLVEKGLLRSDRKSSSTSYKTASGELLEDQGGVLVEGYDQHCRGRSIQGRLVDVHRTLVSGAAVTRKNTVILSDEGGSIVPKDSKIAQELREHLEMLKGKYPKEAAQITEMYVHKGIYVFDLWVNGTVQHEDDKKVLAAVDSGFTRQAQRP